MTPVKTPNQPIHPNQSIPYYLILSNTHLIEISMQSLVVPSALATTLTLHSGWREHLGGRVVGRRSPVNSHGR
jgi:hypothetical protein